MSFRCNNCNGVSKKPHRVVSMVRSHEHIEPRFNEDLDKIMPTITGVGKQIAQEKNLCDKCFQL